MFYSFSHKVRLVHNYNSKTYTERERGYYKFFKLEKQKFIKHSIQEYLNLL